MGRLALMAFLVSIHPPRVGRDNAPRSDDSAQKSFNPPSPCGEGPEAELVGVGGLGFNPPSPCGEGPDGLGLAVGPEDVSIHPPRVGRDLVTLC